MKEIYLGLDLCKKNIQLSYYRDDKSEPQSICQQNNTETFLFPNVMFYDTAENKWYVGNDVAGVRFIRDGVIIENIVENIDSSDHVVVGTASYTYEMLLLILLKTHVQDFISRNDEYVLKGITVTMDAYHPIVYKVLKRFAKELELDQEHFAIISHETAFFQFVMNQDEKLHTVWQCLIMAMKEWSIIALTGKIYGIRLFTILDMKVLRIPFLIQSCLKM